MASEGWSKVEDRSRLEPLQPGEMSQGRKAMVQSGEEALGELPFSPVHPLGFPAHQESKERETASLLILVDLSRPQGLTVSGKAL